MKKVIILAAILVFALVGNTYAGLFGGPRITYGGLVEEDGQFNAIIDTLICVFNPNNCSVRNVMIHVFDKDGNWLISAQLQGHLGQRKAIPRKGWNWITLGMLVNPEPGKATKFTWIVTWNSPSVMPDRGLVIEVKEIVYPVAVSPDAVWYELKNAKLMSETALGGFFGTGFDYE